MHKDRPKPEFIVSEAIERNEASIRRIHHHIEELRSTIDRIRGSHSREGPPASKPRAKNPYAGDG